MRDPVVAQKVGNRSGIGKSRSAVGQRPAKRGANETIGARLKSLLGYVPLALRIGVIAIIGLIAFVGYRAAASASFFQVRTIETRGASRASVEDIESVVRRDVGVNGVWRADLQELSSHLERLPWVRTAVVTRVLPDGIRVRITEREPRAVVRTSAGRFMWVDDDAVYLGEMAPTDQMPAFFLRGWNEDDSATAQAENRARVAKFLELQRDWSAQGLSERVSEVNLLDLRDVRVQLAGDDSQIEVRLGSQEQSARLGKALAVLDAQRQTARGPLISYIDLTQGKRAIVGLVTGSHTIAESKNELRRYKPDMAKRTQHTIGLDIGTSKVTCIAGEPGEGGLLEVVGIGEAEARGLRKGVIVNPDAAVDAIKKAVEDAERMSGLEAEEVTINLAGSHILGFNGQAIVAVSGRDREIIADDVRRAIDSACAIQLPAGREIVDRLPQEFIVDDQDGINDPVGMIGARLAVKVHIVTSPVTARQNAINAVNRAGLVVADMVLEQLAAAEATLTEDDKEFGAALVDVGAETTGLIIYQRGAVQHTAVFPLGGSHFTNDIAFGLRTPIPEAEKIKRTVGCACSSSLSEMERGELVDVPSVGGRPPRQLSRQILCDILQPRAEEVLMHVADEIKDAGWERQLSSGVVLTGGGALLHGMTEIAEQVFDAPVRIGYPERDRFGGLIEDIQSPAWAAAAGLALLAYRAQAAEIRTGVSRRGSTARLTHFVSRFRNRFGSIF